MKKDYKILNKVLPCRIYYYDSNNNYIDDDFVSTAEELAEKVVANQYDKIVTTLVDIKVFDTFGSFVNRVENEFKDWFYDEFYAVLLKAQGFNTDSNNTRKYNMAIYYNKKVIYELEVEAESVETAREIIWDNFIDVAYADEHHHPCGDCAYYGDCKDNPKECDCADFNRKVGE